MNIRYFESQFAEVSWSDVSINSNVLILMHIITLFRSVIMMTNSGYIKRLPIEEFEAQSRGGKVRTHTKNEFLVFLIDFKFFHSSYIILS